MISVGPVDGRTRCRLPDIAAGVLDAAAVRINARHLAQSTAALGRLFPDVGVGDHDFTAPAEVRVERDSLNYSIDDLGVFLRDHDALDSFIVMRDRETVSNLPFLLRQHELWRPAVMNANRIVAGLDDGYTMNFSGVDRTHVALNELAEHVERVFGCLADVSVFLGAGYHVGSGRHADLGELLVIPLGGAKRWQVFEPSLSHPLGPSHASDLGGPVAYDSVLVPGRGLIVPRGWPHEVVPVGQTSVSLTIAFYRPILAAGVVSVANDAVSHPDLRRPFTGGDHGRLRHLIDGAAHRSRAMWDPTALGQAFARGLARIPLRNHSLPRWELLDGRLSSGVAGRLRAPGGIMVAPGAHGEPTWAFGGRTVRFDLDDLPIVEQLMSSTWSSLDDIVSCAALPEHAAALMVAFASEGLIDLAEIDEIADVDDPAYRT